MIHEVWQQFEEGGLLQKKKNPILISTGTITRKTEKHFRNSPEDPAWKGLEKNKAWLLVIPQQYIILEWRKWRH